MVHLPEFCLLQNVAEMFGFECCVTILFPLQLICGSDEVIPHQLNVYIT